MEDLLATAMARRTAAGLSVEVTGIRDRAEPFVVHHRNVAERDAHMARCLARGESVRMLP